MKNTLLRTVVIFVALCIYPSIHAYDFEYDGFYYDITSDSTVSVTTKDPPNMNTKEIL